MSLKERINEDMKSALRAKETARLSAIRLLISEMRKREIDERIQLDDTGIVAVIGTMLKQRRDSISQYDAAGRKDLADAERFEVEVLSAYMPEGASATEIQAAVAQAIADTGAAGPADMGKVMSVLKGKLAGRADMSQVSAQVKAALAPR